MIKLIHFADLHLNAPLSSRVSWDVANQLRETKFKVIDNLIELANEKKVDIILIAGDLFDSRFTDEKTIRFLKDRFAGTKAHIFIACGNHDYLSKNGIQEGSSLGENVTVFGRNLSKVTLNDLKCDIYGASFDSPFIRSGMIEGFRAEDNEHLKLMVMHGDLQAKSDYNPITPEEISDSGLHYLALGHIHNDKKLRKAGKTYYAYSGTPQPHSFKDSIEPSVNFVELSEEECHITHIDISKFRFYQLEIPVSDCHTNYDIKQAILEGVKQYDTQHNLFAVSLCDQIEEGFRIELKLLEEELSSQFMHLEIEDHTNIKLNLDFLKQEQTLRGEFARLVLADENLSAEERQEILECGIHAANPFVTKEGLV